ncbi:MAG TPA: tetratricopeptide repeat protein [archaeon]|nr:tetratricopeptide repeat protein [archaeon]
MSEPGESFFKRYAAYFAVVIFSLAISLPVLRNGFVNYDDPQLVLEPASQGRLDLSLENLTRALVPDPRSSYTPLRWMTFMVCHALGGQTPWVYHLASLLIYTLLCLSVYLFAHRLLGWDEAAGLDRAGRLSRGNLWPLFAAFIFTAHPMNVESLAWVSAIKDLYQALFWMACVLSFIYSENGWKTGKKLTVVFFILAVLSKPSALLLPLVLGAYIFCKPSSEKRFRLPWIVVGTIVMAVIAYLFYLIPHLKLFEVYRHGAGLSSVAAGALKVFLAYLKTFLLPTALSVRYLVRVPLTFFNPQTLLHLLAFLALLWLAIVFWRKRDRLPAFALSWVLVAFLPTSGILPLEILRADRYALVSMPVLAVVLATLLRAVKRRLPPLPGSLLAISSWLVPFLFSVLFIQRLGVWRSSETLWQDVLTVEPRHTLALNNLGAYYVDEGDTTKGMDYLQRALCSNPAYDRAMNTLGLLYEAQGRKGEAEAMLKRAVEQPYHREESLINLGSFYLRSGRPELAEKILTEATEIAPQDPRIHYWLSACYQRSGQAGKALEEMRKALSIEPSSPVYLAGVGRLLILKGEIMEALGLLEDALDRDRNFAPAYLGFGELFSAAGKLEDARTAYEEVLRREPGNLEALRNLASIQGRLGNIDSAAGLLKRLIAENPRDCEALANMVAVCFSLGWLGEALSAVHLAIECDSTQAANYLNAYEIYNSMDSLKPAGMMIAKALRVAPHNPRAIYSRALLSLRTDSRPDTALNYLEKLLRMDVEPALRSRSQALLDSLKKTR